MVPRAEWTNGRAINAAKAIISAMLPALCTHLLNRKPDHREEREDCNDETVGGSDRRDLLAVSPASPTNAYERLVAMSNPTVDSSRTAYIHKFQATMKPATSPRPVFAHW